MNISKATPHYVIFTPACHLLLKSLFTSIVFTFFLIAKSYAYSSPSIQLAKHYKKGVDVSQYLISEKFDGVRFYWDGKRLMSRSGRVIRSPIGFTKGLPKEQLEGELWLSYGSFDQISGISRQKVPENALWNKMNLMVFDMPNHSGVFSERYEAMKKIISTTNHKHLKLIKQFRVKNHDALVEKLKEVTQNGGEGLMLHKANSIYKAGRNDDVLKFKEYHDDEAMVVHQFAGKGNFKGMMGSILAETPDGITFRIASGFTKQDRKFPPHVGSMITYKFYGKTKTGKPKFPSYIRPRD